MIWFLSLGKGTQLLLAYFLVINLITFFYFGIDKWKSTLANSQRVRERTLWILTLIGGSGGAMLAMHLFRHKTRKASFQAIMTLILLLHTTIVFLLLQRQL